MGDKRVNCTVPTLDHRDPSLGLVRDLRLTTQAHDLLILHHSRNHPRYRIREHLRIGIHTQHNLVPIRRHARTPPDRVEELVLEGRHALVEHHALEERHEHDLTVTLSTVTGLRPFRGLADLDDDNVPGILVSDVRRMVRDARDLRYDVTFELI